MTTSNPPNQIGNPAAAIPVYDVGGSAIATNGVVLPIGELAQALAYDGSNNLQTITVTYLGHTYVQTFTMTGTNLTGISAWVQTS
jgi:hypothetical protein